MTELLKDFVEEAEERKAREIAERMFHDGASVSDVMRWTGLSEEEAQEVLKRVREEA